MKAMPTLTLPFTELETFPLHSARKQEHDITNDKHYQRERERGERGGASVNVGDKYSGQSFLTREQM